MSSSLPISREFEKLATCALEVLSRVEQLKLKAEEVLLQAGVRMADVQAKVEQLNTPGQLLPGVKLDTIYDRTNLIHLTTTTVRQAIDAGNDVYAYLYHDESGENAVMAMWLARELA